YTATKGAIESFTRALAEEVGQYGITVNAIAPGGIDTDMSRAVMTAEYRERRLRELPLRRFGHVEDVAYCAVVLASNDAGYSTGQILHPSGGWVMGCRPRARESGPRGVPRLVPGELDGGGRPRRRRAGAARRRSDSGRPGKPTLAALALFALVLAPLAALAPL